MAIIKMQRIITIFNIMHEFKFHFNGVYNSKRDDANA